MSDLQQEHQREIEGLLDNIRELNKEFRLQSMVIDSFIPQEFQVSVYCIQNIAMLRYICLTLSRTVR